MKEFEQILTISLECSDRTHTVSLRKNGEITAADIWKWMPDAIESIGCTTFKTDLEQVAGKLT